MNADSAATKEQKTADINEQTAAEQDDIYITEEELAGMSEKEITDWLEALSREVNDAITSGDVSLPGLSLDELDKAYESGEYKEFLEQAEGTDITDVMFGDKEEIGKINQEYRALQAMAEGTAADEIQKAYESLYAMLYSYIRRVNPLWEVGDARLDIWAKLQDGHRTVYTLTPETAGAFKNLCSEDEFSLIGRENIFAFGSVRRVRNEEQASGILIFEVLPPDEERFEMAAVIRWLYVDENMRTMHVADDLMAALYHAVNKTGIKAVGCEIPVKDRLPVQLGEFLTCWWMNFNLEARTKTTLTVSEILALPDPEKKARPVNIMSLSGFGEEAFSLAVEHVMKNKGKKNYALTDIEKLDPELSIALLKAGKPQCFVLTERMPSGILKIRRLAGNKGLEDETYLSLIKYAAEKAAETYGEDTHVFIEPVAGLSMGLFERLFPKKGSPLYLVGGNVSAEAELTTDIFEQLRVMYENDRNDQK